MTAQALQSFQPVSTLPTPQVTPPTQNVPSAGVLGAGSVTPPSGDVTAPGADMRISTRVPDAVGAEQAMAPHGRNDLEVGLDAARQSPDAHKKNANLIRTYSHVRTEGLNDDQVHEAFVQHLTDNLVDLHDRIDPTIRAGSKRWYDGANKIANRWAEEYGLQPHQVAGVLAALSPQKDWFQNVDLAKRLLDMNQRGGNYATDKDMQAKLRQYAGAVKNDKHRAAMEQHVADIGSKALGQITDPMQRAMWMRAYDEVHNDRSYRVVTPEGDFGNVARTAKGKQAPQKVAWGSFKEIHKAIQAMNDPSLENISRNMGGNHKVRNFYNNIIAPNYGRDATVDTHAIAAANMIPAGSNHELVAAGLGLKGASSAATGSRGLYPHYIEAHRRAADIISARGEPTLPRELQSITWEGIRGTFTPEQKRNKAFVAANKAIWDSYGKGDIDATTARNRVIAHAAPEGIRDPSYLRSGVTDDAE